MHAHLPPFQNSPIQDAKRIVIKIGSALIAGDDLQPRANWMASLAADIAALQANGIDILIVSSGAGALGRSFLGAPKRKHMKLEAMQAAAAIGQPLLMQAWGEAFAPHAKPTAQALITLDDTQNRERYLNARETLQHLLSHNIIPIINENDTVANDEIRYGDNDRLAAQIAAMVGADCLILFSDIDGLYSAHPAKDATAEHIAQIDVISETIMAMAEDTTGALGSGGMKTKLLAAQIATQAGCAMVIADGRKTHPLSQLSGGARHSLFTAQQSPLDARRHWIANASKVQGSIHIDEGAATALRAGKSLLPSGITKVEGDFARGAIIAVHYQNQTPLAQGISTYAATDIAIIRGKQTGDIAQLLGYTHGDTVIHRNDMVII